MGGLSTWRGKSESSSGAVVLDREAGLGAIDVRIDTTFLDFGHAKMNEHAKSADRFDVAKTCMAPSRHGVSSIRI